MFSPGFIFIFIISCQPYFYFYLFNGLRRALSYGRPCRSFRKPRQNDGTRESTLRAAPAAFATESESRHVIHAAPLRVHAHVSRGLMRSARSARKFCGLDPLFVLINYSRSLFLFLYFHQGLFLFLYFHQGLFLFLYFLPSLKLYVYFLSRRPGLIESQRDSPLELTTCQHDALPGRWGLRCLQHEHV